MIFKYTTRKFPLAKQKFILVDDRIGTSYCTGKDIYDIKVFVSKRTLGILADILGKEIEIA